MSESGFPLDSELRQVESALGSLRPAQSRVDRDRLMYRAGERRGRSSGLVRWAWPAVAATLAMVAGGEAFLLNTRPEMRVVERLVVVHDSAIETSPEVSEQPRVQVSEVVPRTSRDGFVDEGETGFGSSATAQYARLRRQVLRFGVDALPEPAPLALQAPREAPQAAGALLREEIERVLNPGESS